MPRYTFKVVEAWKSKTTTNRTAVRKMATAKTSVKASAKPNIKKMAKVMKALSHEKRLSLYLEIAENQESSFEVDGCHIAQVVSMLKLSAPTISHHLKELVNAELISTEKRGKFLAAIIDKQTLAEVSRVFSGILKP
jgi:ArsR family transcriptional regulator